MIPHPAYPTARETAFHARAEALAEAVFATNRTAHAILSRAIVELGRLDLTTESMAQGYGLDDMIETLRDMLPNLGGTAYSAMVRRCGEMLRDGEVV